LAKEIEAAVTAGWGTPVETVFGILPCGDTARNEVLTDDPDSSGFGRESSRGFTFMVVKGPGPAVGAAAGLPVPVESVAENPIWTIGLAKCDAGDPE